MSVAARAPNHLGDGILARPALHALAQLGPLTIHAPPWARFIYEDIPARIVPRGQMEGDVAVLLAPSLRAAWEARRCPRRIGLGTDHRRWLLTDVVACGGHRAQEYQRLAEAAGARVTEAPPWRADGVAPEVPAGHVGLNPVVTADNRAWHGWTALADRIARPVVFYGGPGEDAAVARVSGAHRRVVGTTLPVFAAALQRCAVFVSNDSGGAHVARLVGRPTVVVFGSTTSGRTGPPGALGVEGPDLACRPCYRRFCSRPGGGAPCLDIPVDAVWARVREALGG